MADGEGPGERGPACPVGESVLAFTDTDPFPFYDRARAIGSPQWDQQAKAWLVLDYQQCVESARDETRFANAYVFADPMLAAIKGGGANITLSRDEEHVKLRRFHFKLFSAANIESFRTHHITPVIETALAKLAGRQSADLAGDYAAQIPPRVICSLLGMPIDDDAMVGEILEANETIVRFIASGYADMALRDQALVGSARLNAMLAPYVAARRNDPRDDFISRVWSEAAAFKITLDEAGALGVCRELFFAGSDTTVHGIANALDLALADPATTSRLRADRDKALPALVEEALRLRNVVQFRHRICMGDTTIGDVAIRKGETIILLHAAANRDPGHFPHPDAMDLDRAEPTDHLAFGRGTRSCVGASLARAEMTEAVSQLLDRFPHIRLDPAAEPPHFRGFYMRSMGPLNVRLTA